MRRVGHRSTRLAALVILLAGLAAYANTFSTPFVFDGAGLILESPRIHRLWPLQEVVGGTNRPVGFLTFAVNYAVFGENVWGYHATNLAIHMGGALALFGIVRRTLLLKRFQERYGQAAWGIALAAALVWLVHPLQTESVTNLYQRFESMMGLLFLLVFYCFVRGQDSSRPILWYAVSIVCCFIGLGVKEVMAVAPLLLLWYDRVFVANSWKEILRRRWPLYTVLVGVPALMGVMLVKLFGVYRGGGILVVEGVSPLDYALSQPAVILHYLRLTFLPVGLCFDYGWPVARSASEIVPPLVVVAGLLGATAWTAIRYPAWGFLGGWFFLILAPTSSVFPIVDLAFEHRMYLPLAAVAVAVVAGGYEVLKVAGTLRVPSAGYGNMPRAHARRDRTADGTRSVPATMPVATLAAVVVLLAGLTYARNTVYQSNVALWSDVVAQAPEHARGHYNLAHALETEGEFAAAIEHYRRAVELDPKDPVAHNNLANLLAGSDPAAARWHYELALKLKPDYADPLTNIAVICLRQGEVEAAVGYCRRAVELRPNSAHAHTCLAHVLAEHRAEEAIEHYRTALQLDPNSAEAHFQLANTLVLNGHVAEGIPHLREALRLRPDWPEARRNLEILLEANEEKNGGDRKIGKEHGRGR